MRLRTWLRCAAAVTVSVTVSGLAAPTDAATAAEAHARDTASRPTRMPAEPVIVRLVTGDRVSVMPGPGGRRTASVRPGPGRERLAFRILEQGDDSLLVLPSDAEALVAAGTLDRRLFDVTALADQGYDEAHAEALPLIVSSRPAPDGTPTTAAESRAAATTADRLAAHHAPGQPSLDLPSIDSRSLRVPGEELGAFWKTLNADGPSPTRTAGPAGRASTTPVVSLDGAVKAVLDRSTAQINAPSAWQLGRQGDGVRVAVLDTGVDATHPDLVGRITAAEDFSDSGNTDDHFGHGTHVAATVGGTGAGAKGSRRGVAPKADLLIGKVLGDNGYGSESQVIAGMEWAAEADARIVNMSLGSDAATDGTDPMSLALNALSASTDTLFVVAAGNAGPGPATVGSPGAADAALTVGAVDRTDALASFSSRGPRYGDGAAKPDITAPGVGIVAARAAGTTMGEPVDARYTAASGTSMATPHVAGAAALLAQQHPDWSARQLKDALISTSRTISGTKVTEQGGGRVDVAAAAGPLTATGSVTLPLVVRGGGARQEAATLRYTNTGDVPVDLRLAVRLAGSGGQALPDGVVAVGTDRVRIAAGTTAEVPLATDPTRAARGKYFGYVTATDADGRVVVHTTVSLAVRGERHRLTVVVRDRDGQVRPGELPNIWGSEGLVGYTDREAATAVVEEGTYFLNSSYVYQGDDGDEVRELFAPEVKVTRDTTVTLSAAAVAQVRIRTPRPAEQRGILNTAWFREIDGYRWSWSSMYFDMVKRVYASTSAPVTQGQFEFSSRWQLAAPQLRAEVAGTALRFTPYYEPTSPDFGAHGARLTAVDAGTCAAPAFGRARGKLAVLRCDDIDDATLARAKSAGVKAVMLVWSKGQTVWSWWQPNGVRKALPMVRAPWAQGNAVLERVRSGRSTVVTFSGTVRSPYLYDVMQVARGSVPRQLVHTVSERESAVVRATYTRSGDATWASEQRFAWRPHQQTGWSNESSRYVPLGSERIEYVSGGDTMWTHVVHHDVVPDPHRQLQVGMRDQPHAFRPGQQVTERWFAAPVRPSIPQGGLWPSVRTGDTLSVRIPEFTDSAPGHWAFAEVTGLGPIRTASPAEGAGDAATAVLYRDGKQVFSSDNGAFGDIEVQPGEARYRLDLTTSRTSENWHFGTRTHTSWGFVSGTQTSTALLPLLQVDYEVPVDARNAVGPQRSHTVGLSVRMQDGMAAPRVVRLRVEASYDGGGTWTAVRSAPRGDGDFTADVERPARVRGDAYVTLRVTVADQDGNTMQQTVERAYLHRGGTG